MSDNGAEGVRQRSRELFGSSERATQPVFSDDKIRRLITELETIRQSAYWVEGEHETELAKVAEPARESARNLLHYLALRRRDMRQLQRDLASRGLSSLGLSESHVLGTIENLLEILHRMIGEPFERGAHGLRPVHYREGKARLAANTEALFGLPEMRADGSNPSVHIMVTLPSTAAIDYRLVHDLVDSGARCLRINCAHDGPEAWAAMVGHLEQARRETGRDCRLFMDLAGPKIRTGDIEPGPRVVRWQPKHDIYGELVAPALVWITPAENPGVPPMGLKVDATVPIDGAILATLERGDEIRFRELRGRRRSLVLFRQHDESWIGRCDQITYLGADCTMKVKPAGGAESRAFQDEFQPAIEPREQHLALLADDTVFIAKDPTACRPSLRNLDGRLVEEPRISCATPEVLDCVEPGHRVLFDDGKVSGVVMAATSEGLRVRVTHPVNSTKKVRAVKGINFPDSDLKLPALTEQDLEALDFVVEHADIVGLSFVNRPSDVEELERQIYRRTSRPMGIVLKIETQRAFEELPMLLLTALRNERVGVMIARGDLAVECGYQRLAELQEEILWICEAAHVPVIWATQVLERYNKKGVPTRAEISDAAMSDRAECVMLNKGPYVVETVRFLGDILGRMESHHDKKSPTLRELKVSRPRT